MPHFAAFFLNPGTAHIPNLNNFLPWHEEWFVNGISKETFRVTHACIKNVANQYRPTWLQSGETIRQHIVHFLSKRIHKHQMEEQARKPVLSRPQEEKDPIQNSDTMAKRTKFQLFGPKLNQMHLSGGDKSDISPLVKADRMILEYEQYHKGYSQSQVAVELSEQVALTCNEDLKVAYDTYPRVFWTDKTHCAVLGSSLVSFARYIFSILSSSARPEREFSRMSYLITKRRSSYTASNTNKRLTLANLIPQKRRLEELLTKRKVKKVKLFCTK